jgi:hypothetical protein
MDAPADCNKFQCTLKRNLQLFYFMKKMEKQSIGDLLDMYLIKLSEEMKDRECGREVI